MNGATVGEAVIAAWEKLNLPPHAVKLLSVDNAGYRAKSFRERLAAFFKKTLNCVRAVSSKDVYDGILRHLPRWRLQGRPFPNVSSAKEKGQHCNMTHLSRH